MMYCDSNLFIYPAIYVGGKAAMAGKVLEALAEGKLEGLTCSLTIDEVLWIVWKNASKVAAIEQAKRVLEFPNLKVVDTRASDMRKAMDLIKKYDLRPRDAIHAACSLNHAIFSIISDDADFDAVGELKRLSFEDVVSMQRL
ncbi:MAG: type II toxin-antitoxin system VapC family toxin [Candidatus Hodarchaeaceae archaeon]|nr:type II toxin-antitoxin system VapC family toxin [Candidatus Hodarchaeaceae archaeon]